MGTKFESTVSAHKMTIPKNIVYIYILNPRDFLGMSRNFQLMLDGFFFDLPILPQTPMLKQQKKTNFSVPKNKCFQADSCKTAFHLVHIIYSSFVVFEIPTWSPLAPTDNGGKFIFFKAVSFSSPLFSPFLCVPSFSLRIYTDSPHFLPGSVQLGG